jgi:hypothetical protein
VLSRRQIVECLARKRVLLLRGSSRTGLRIETDPMRGREVLSRFVAPVILTPEAEGPERRYRATGAFNLSFLLTAAAMGESRSGKFGCAGPQLDFPARESQDDPELWVPFEEAVVIGWT